MTSIVRSNQGSSLIDLRDSIKNKNTNVIRSRKAESTMIRNTVLFSATGVGILGSALNIANTIIGGGILELPYVMS